MIQLITGPHFYPIFKSRNAPNVHKMQMTSLSDYNVGFTLNRAAVPSFFDPCAGHVEGFHRPEARYAPFTDFAKAFLLKGVTGTFYIPHFVRVLP